MDLPSWLKKNRPNFGSDYELLFAESVLPLIPELTLDAVSVQYPFKDRDRRQRYCDFVIQEGEDVRIAIEIDGYDKRGTGTGMSHADFVDWQRRQAALTSHGWYVLRFANRDVRDYPQRCAEHVSLLLRKLRGKLQDRGLNDQEKARLAELNQTQNIEINQLKRETGVMKTTVVAFTTLILALVGVIVWQGSGGAVAAQGREAETVPLSASYAGDSRQGSPGTSCENHLSWKQASQNVGQSMAVVGPVMRVTVRDDVRGKPTWIEVGAPYPSPERVTLVLWGKNRQKFGISKPALEGKTVCVVGPIGIYKGISQIELSQPGQLRVVP